MGTTNQKPITPKQAEKARAEAEKKAKSSGWQSMAYKFANLKSKK